MKKSEYISAYATIKRVFQEENRNETFARVFALIFFLFVIRMFFGPDPFDLTDCIHVIFWSVPLLLLLYLVVVCFSWEKYFFSTDRYRKTISLLDEHYKSGKSVDEFWEHESLKDFFPEKV